MAMNCNMDAPPPPTAQAADAARCSVCLSTARQVTELGALQRIYDVLTEDGRYSNKDVKQMKPIVCWECKATFKRIYLFKLKIHKAQRLLLAHPKLSEINECLSSLCRTPTVTHDCISICSSDEVLQQLLPKLETIKTESPDLELNEDKVAHEDCSDNTFIEDVQKNECFETFYTRTVSENSDDETLRNLFHDKIELKRENRVSACETATVQKQSKQKRAKLKKKLKKKEKNEIPVQQLKNEMKNQWSCDSCVKSFETRAKFTYHKRTVHSDPVLCNECGKVFNFKPSLEKHMLTHFGGIPKYPCAICGKSFAGRAGVKSHMLHMHCEPTDQVFRCEPCDLTFKTVYKYRGHVKWSRKHGGIGTERHECEVCHRRYKTKRRLLEHHSYTHLGRAQHECHICNKKISSLLGLQKHVQLVHERREVPRTHVCEVCGDAFKRASLLRQHCYIHTGEKPHGCAVCGAKFRQKGSLYTHTKLAHRKLSAKI